jgi:hypothetical protein
MYILKISAEDPLLYEYMITWSTELLLHMITLITWSPALLLYWIPTVYDDGEPGFLLYGIT